jgi:uncharacterized protein
MRALLDVNVLIALFDEDHVFHNRAHTWLELNSALGIATCPMTENGLVRVLSHPKYSAAFRLAPIDVIERLAEFCAAQNHEFWADTISLRESEHFDAARILGSRQITDLYLLSLAVKNKGQLVTFDQGIEVTAVPLATLSNLVVI